MSLLPKSSKDFASQQYWNDFFSSRARKPFEWYGEYMDLCSVLHKYMKVKDDILVPGCGNSSLSADLYKLGFKNITNVDISEIVIRQMKVKHAGDCQNMSWHQENIMDLPFEGESFSCILDKGTADALVSDASEEAVQKCTKYLMEMNRMLRVGGRMIVISLLQESVAKILVSWFEEAGWLLRLCKCDDSCGQSEEGESVFSHPVFALIATKFKKNTNLKSVFELCFDGKSVHRVSDSKKLLAEVSTIQHFAFLRKHLQTQSIIEESYSVELCDTESGSLRYILHIVDGKNKNHKHPFAVFIVPQGRESEYVFSNRSGHLQLLESAGVRRLIVVHLCRNQSFGSIQDVQNELSAKVLQLAPPEMTVNTKIPFLSVGTDLCERKEVFRGKSPYSGEFIIEDIHSEDNLSYTLRRLIFLNNQNIIQSEAKLLNAGSLSKQPHIDFSYLSCIHHIAMVMSMALVSNANSAKVALLGLGGGSLAAYLQNTFKQLQLTAVDIDPAVVDIAENWFGFDSRRKGIKVCVQDGIQFIEEQKAKELTYDVILFDLDSKELQKGLSCPPEVFLQKDFLQTVKDCITEQGGISH